MQHKGNDMTKLKPMMQSNKVGKLWLFAIPAIVFAVIFSYMPMFGLIMAFKKNIDLSAYNDPFSAIMYAEWAGFEQFALLFNNENFMSAFANTLIISLLKIVLVFPIPIVLAILMTELRHKKFNKFVQMIVYLPHFLSWAIVATMFISFLRVDVGALNIILKAFGIDPINVSDPSQFRMIAVWTTAWKDVGWSAVTYIAAILAIDQEQFEAARIDGAGKFKQVLYITLPSIANIIAVLLILRIGYVMDAGFEQIYALLTPTAESTGEIIGTLIYKVGLKQNSYEFATAAGLFNSVISLFLILGGNWVCKKVFHRGII